MSTPTFLVTTPLPAPGMQILAEAGRVVSPAAPLSREELHRECSSGRVDVLVSQLVDPVDADLLAAATLTGVSNYAAGYNNIDVPAATARSIMVANTPDILTRATADLTLLLILGTARRVVESDQFLRSGAFTGWQPDLLLGHDVSGRTLGLAGFGRIGRAVAQRALAFDMTVRFCPRPPTGRPVDPAEYAGLAGDIAPAGWDEVVSSSDFLSLHVPLTVQTRHLVDEDVLRRMKDSAILVNTARGPVVDEAALVRALVAGDIAGAGLDVYEHEPALSPGLAELSNTVLLPHLGSATEAVRADMARVCAHNAVAMARGQLPAHPVNPDAWA
ncbi:D-glycerate dehydrogenase [Citricoccus sp. NPDC055426]|uniref:2-hydroxyacid dehydrogenase n=1 Tax=Citricoccus sp. NPDC055426 TaxID=3155536 RepID=UPI0034460F8B